MKIRGVQIDGVEVKSCKPARRAGTNLNLLRCFVTSNMDTCSGFYRDSIISEYVTVYPLILEMASALHVFYEPVLPEIDNVNCADIVCSGRFSGAFANLEDCIPDKWSMMPFFRHENKGHTVISGGSILNDLMTKRLSGDLAAYESDSLGMTIIDSLAAKGTPINEGCHFGLPAKVYANTIAVCDGIAMGHTGMKYSLASRKIIADSVETMARACCFDDLVCIPNCDKIIPAMLMAALRLNIPTIFVSGGSILNDLMTWRPSSDLAACENDSLGMTISDSLATKVTPINEGFAFGLAVKAYANTIAGLAVLNCAPMPNTGTLFGTIALKGLPLKRVTGSAGPDTTPTGADYNSHFQLLTVPDAFDLVAPLFLGTPTLLAHDDTYDEKAGHHKREFLISANKRIFGLVATDYTHNGGTRTGDSYLGESSCSFTDVCPVRARTFCRKMLCNTMTSYEKTCIKNMPVFGMFFLTESLNYLGLRLCRRKKF